MFWILGALAAGLRGNAAASVLSFYQFYFSLFIQAFFKKKTATDSTVVRHRLTQTNTDWHRLTLWPGLCWSKTNITDRHLQTTESLTLSQVLPDSLSGTMVTHWGVRGGGGGVWESHRRSCDHTWQIVRSRIFISQSVVIFLELIQD